MSAHRATRGLSSTRRHQAGVAARRFARQPIGPAARLWHATRATPGRSLWARRPSPVADELVAATPHRPYPNRGPYRVGVGLTTRRDNPFHRRATRGDMARRRPVWCSTFSELERANEHVDRAGPPAPISPEIVPEIVPHARFRNGSAATTSGFRCGLAPRS